MRHFMISENCLIRKDGVRRDNMKFMFLYHCFALHPVFRKLTYVNGQGVEKSFVWSSHGTFRIITCLRFGSHLRS